MEASRPPGTIITFYSYKGGTGRSMTLANVAWILASNGKRVLTIDWDLEAPGLHRYFWPFLLDKDLTASDGVIDFVFDYTTLAMTPPDAKPPTGDPGDENRLPADGSVPQASADERWYEDHANILRYASSLDWKDFPRIGDTVGGIDFIPSGRQGPAYATRVSSFNWPTFYERLGGGAFLEAAREKMRAEYDYVLIDSRTGLSDTSGICTVQMPDILVVCFTFNHQSIEGAAAVAVSAHGQRRGSSPIRIFPVPMRVDLAEKEKVQARREYARSKFGLFPDHLDTSEREAYWGAVELLYDPFYAYEEVLTTFGDKPGRPASLLGGTERLTAYLTDGTVKQLTAPPESTRSEVLAQYARKKTLEAPQDEARAAERVFSQLAPEEQEHARRLLSRLVRLASPSENTADRRIGLAVAECAEFRQLLPPLVSAGVLQVEVDRTSKAEVVQLANDDLLQQWKRLRGWLEEDRDFLLWRQLLREKMAEWEANRHDTGALLSGSPLQVATRWREIRGADLSRAEQSYISASSTFQEELTSRQEELEREKVHAQQELQRARAHARRIRVATGIGVFATLIVLSVSIYWTLRNTHAAQIVAASAVQAAKQLAEGGRIEAALELYDSTIRLQPDYAPAYLDRGLLYLNTGAKEKAIADLNTVLKLGNDSRAEHVAASNLEAIQVGGSGWADHLVGASIVAPTSVATPSSEQ